MIYFVDKFLSKSILWFLYYTDIQISDKPEPKETTMI